MRKFAFAFISAGLTTGLPLNAVADTFVPETISYSITNDATYSETYQAAPSVDYGYADLSAIESSEFNYAPQDVIYQVVEQAPYALETASYDVYEVQAASDFSEGSMMTETIDGIVYETILTDGNVMADEVQIIQTY